MVNLNNEFQTTFIFATHDEKVISYVRRKIYLVDGKVFKDELVSRNQQSILQ
jgi:putative ABC transport system ATP-binding protein